MNKKILQGLEWLDKEIKKDEISIEQHKKLMIDEILKIDKTKMFSTPEKKKVTFLEKIGRIFGYGKKR